MKQVDVLYDKVTLKGHTYTIVLIPSLYRAMVLYNTRYIPHALHIAGVTKYEVHRERDMIQTAIEGDLIYQLIQEEGLILPTEKFYCIEIPYQALYEGVFNK